MSHKQKILQYLEFKGVSQGKFSKKCGFSNGFLTSGMYIGTDKLVKIVENYPDFNIFWLLFNKGEMVLNSDFSDLKVSEDRVGYHLKDSCERRLSYEKLIQAKDETISILKHQLGIDKSKVS